MLQECAETQNNHSNIHVSRISSACFLNGLVAVFVAPEETDAHSYFNNNGNKRI